jgi:predicted ATPase
MKFKVIPYKERIPSGIKSAVLLVTDGWDDWFQFSTMYNVIYADENGETTRIGEVKIGQFSMEKDQRRPSIPSDFETLDERFFSIGQDDSYYQNLTDIGDSFRVEFLLALRDLSTDEELFKRALEEKVTGVSLLRYVSEQTVRGQFRRMAKGQARLTPFYFSFTPPKQFRTSEVPKYTFDIVPESFPPTNVHVIIGRNGVGKTHTINNLTNAIIKANEKNSEGEYGLVEWREPEGLEDEDNSFSHVISVAFSAFDPFEPATLPINKTEKVRYQYIGLKHTTKDANGDVRPPKSPDDLAADFGKSVQAILAQPARRERWRQSIKSLESDVLFQRASVWQLAEIYDDYLERMERKTASTEFRKEARRLFVKLSSGHKIVLLTISRLVETLEERSLVLMDEPEAHLHPPLLSALIRAISELLYDRNGVAIIATHSPVILQEVPRTCVWRIRRTGRITKASRPDRETFGENVGALTHEIFGLEVTASGFHNLLTSAIEQGLTYEEVLLRFNHQLGDEARTIVRSLIASREL